MTSEWPLVSIAELAAEKGGSLAVGPFGSRMKADLYVPSGVRVIRGNNLGAGRQLNGDFVHVTTETADSLVSCCLSPGDLVFPHRGNIGEVGITPDDGHRYMLSTSLMKLSPDKRRVDPLFLFYYFKSSKGRAALLMNASQVGTPGIATPLKSLRGIQLNLPPLKDQRAIAGLLRSLDDRITLLRGTNATLESIAQALFKSWFVDFDPVRAKMEGRSPKGMDEATAALFPAEFEESELGLIPKGWRAGRLSDVAVLNEKSWSARRAPAMVTYVDLTSVKANVFEAAQQMSFDDAPSRARRELRAGDTLVGTVRPGNRSFGFVANKEEGLTGSTGFAVLSPRTATAAAFTYLGATRDENIARLAALADGGAYPAVHPELVSNTACALATEPVLLAFDGLTRSLLDSIAANSNRARTIAELRDTLLPRLISGQLRLPEALSLPPAASHPQGALA